MKHPKNASPVPILGFCDDARHRLRPVLISKTLGEGRREELEILMVCSRCGYSRNARQLQQASEQLAREIFEASEGEEIDARAQGELDDALADPEDEQNKSESRTPPRKKLN